jgi:hypothetical protein
MRLSGVQGCFFLIGFLIAGGAPAQPSDATRGIEQLRQRMNPSITQKPPAMGQGPAVEAPKASGWTRMAVGLGEAQVTELLGAPDRVERQPHAARWQWEQGAEKGWVDFSNESRKVIEWRTY